MKLSINLTIQRSSWTNKEKISLTAILELKKILLFRIDRINSIDFNFHFLVTIWLEIISH